MGCTQSKDAEDSAAARHNRELQRSLEQVRRAFCGRRGGVGFRDGTRALLIRGITVHAYGKSVRKKCVICCTDQRGRAEERCAHDAMCVLTAPTEAASEDNSQRGELPLPATRAYP